MRTGANHAAHVVSATAAHVQNGAARQVGEMRQNPIPFPVGAPFGIEMEWHAPIPQDMVELIDALRADFEEHKDDVDWL
jgi:hypothetical protein